MNLVRPGLSRYCPEAIGCRAYAREAVASEEITEWFQANEAFFHEIDETAKGLLPLIASRNRIALEAAASRLLAVLIRGQQLPPIPDAEAQRHFAAGLARYKDAAKTLVGTDDEAELMRVVRAIDASHAEFARMSEAIGRAQGLS